MRALSKGAGTAALILLCLPLGVRGAAAQPDPTTAPPAAGGVLRITPAKEHLVLGDQDRLELRVEAPGELEGLELTTNIGQIGPPGRAAGGGYVAVYRPPELFYPQIAIVSATARLAGKEVFGYRALKLWGKGSATVKTSPRAEVTVRIGSRSHGPVRANKEGIAQVPVVVPPGVRFGWDGQRKVDLDLPPMNHLQLFALPPRVSGVEGEQVSLYLVAVNDDGSPLTGAASAPRVQAFGVPTSQRSVGAGLWRADVTVPAGKPAGLTVTASIPGDAASTARIELQRQAGQAALLTLDVAAVVGDLPLSVTARLTDKLGTPVDGPVLGSSSEGTFEPFVRRATGEYQGLWRPPARPRQRFATLRVAAGPARAEARVRFLNVRQSVRPLWFWTGVITSSALLATGIATQVVLLNKSSEYKDPGTTLERRQELEDGGAPLIAVSGVTLGLGAAAAVATTVLYFYTDFERGDQETTGGPSTTLSAGPVAGGGAVWLGGRW